MKLPQKILLFGLLLTIFPLTFGAFGQSTADSYEKLWRAIQSDTLSQEKKLHFLESYYRKAQIEKNTLEEYRALEKKSFMVSFDEAVLLLKKMQPLVKKIANDSLKGDFLNTNVVLYYKNRHFEEALDYAIESESYNAQAKNLYNLNMVRVDIGNIYYHTRHYDRAVFYFTKAKNYYQTKKDYNHLRGYVGSLYSLSKAYWQLQDAIQLAATIKESEQAVVLLNPKHQLLETAYLDYVKGGLAFLQNNDSEATKYFEAALPAIKENGDFTNEHVIYLYLGKILWRQNKKDQAVTYLTKIDELFREKEFLNYELRETYEYLIAYYKEKKLPQQQLQATESLIALNNRFEKEQLSITKTLHTELDTKKLETERAALQQLLKSNKKTYRTWLMLAAVGLLFMAVLMYRQNKAQKKLKKKFDELLQNTPSEEVKVSVPKTDSATESSKPKSAAVKVTEQRLLQLLEKFESEKRYLEPVKLYELAEEFGTNRNTLSTLINEHKGSFNTYINKLRINQFVRDLTYQPDLRKMSLDELATMYGFVNAKTLSIKFKEETELTPNYFLKQLELRDIELSRNAS